MATRKHTEISIKEKVENSDGNSDGKGSRQLAEKVWYLCQNLLTNKHQSNNSFLSHNCFALCMSINCNRVCQ